MPFRHHHPARGRQYRICEPARGARRSEEHTSELQSLMRISYAVFCLKKKKIQTKKTHYKHHTHQQYQQATDTKITKETTTYGYYPHTQTHINQHDHKAH